MGSSDEEPNVVVTISAVIKAKNEENRIGRCIEAARLLVDEVLVVDDDSHDSTRTIATAAGARVIRSRSQGGRIDELDKIGIESSTGDWVLRIDADEIMTPSLAHRLRQVAAEGAVNGVRFARKNYMFGDWLRYGGWFAPDQLRFFRKDAYADAWRADLHSQVDVSGPVLALPADPTLATDHHDYESVSAFVVRSLDGYALTEAAELLRRGERFSRTGLLTRCLRKLLGRFVLRRGYKDGDRGFIMAVLLSLYEAAVYCHLWDLEREYPSPSQVEQSSVDS